MSSDPPRQRWISAAVAASLTLAIVAGALLYRPDDAPFRPHDDAEVIERVVPGTGADPPADELRAMEQALARAPNDLSRALTLARRQLEIARRTDDLNRLAYAEAALAPWWESKAPPVEVRMVRAAIREARHEHPEARADLDAAVTEAPRDAQAWLARAEVLRALALYDEARRSCGALHELAPPIVEATCAASIDGTAGGAAANVAASARLSALLAGPGIDAADVDRAERVLAQASICRGDETDAAQHLRAALVADPGDARARATLADQLLAAHREKDVLTLIGSDETNTVLLLRRAIAATALRLPEAPALRERMRARAEELHARGDQAHRHEEALRVLYVEDDPLAAVPLAAMDFAQQKEPAAARLLLEAARRATERAPARRAEFEAAAQPARAWIAETGCAGAER